MRALPSCLALLLFLPQCGGGGSAGTSGDAKSASDASSSRGSESDGDEPVTSEGEDEGAEKSAAATCDDGTCSPCGDGICPSGWYCDEKASACSWLTECADKPSCSCVSRVLGSGCKCREEGGGLKVSCD